MTMMAGGSRHVAGRGARCAWLAAGYTSQDQFAGELGFDRTVIVKAETRGAAAVRRHGGQDRGDVPRSVQRAVRAARGDRAEVERADPPGRFADWVAIEAKAASLRWWEPLLILGLLQNRRARGHGDAA